MPATGPATNHAAADRCPGVLRLTEAADGYLARVRLPGGLIGAGPLRVLARLAAELGDGRAELTSRGNVQLRGLAEDAAGPLTDELARAGLLPSLGHDRVRNVLASPLAGLDGGPDLTAIIQRLDAALCARPRLAELPGRFLFAIDDGRGDVAGLGADVVARVRADGAVVNGLTAPGTLAGTTPSADHCRLATDVVAAMLACAEAFLDLRAAELARSWRISRPACGPSASAPRPQRVSGLLPLRSRRRVAGRSARPVPRPRPGRRGPAVPPRAAGSARAADLCAADLARQPHWRAPARITPWRSVVLPDLPTRPGPDREAAGLGFGMDARSPWLRVTACAGRPGCASALADVQADAAEFAARWPGAARACQRVRPALRPARRHRD